jgi:putative radical SAM enzyme (TIGR03279 family)
VKITTVEPGSIAEELGLRPGDELLEVNGRKVLDAIDFRFRESDEEVSLKIARDGQVTLYDVEKDQQDRIGIDFEEMKVLACGNDCIFCFVDQNPKGLRSQVYFRDGDYRLSFMYGNYTTMTNAGPAILERIVEQRLSPQYISVHVTDLEVRRRLMGLKKDDRILEKIEYLHDRGIDLHTQIVLCPGINDGAVLEKTVRDLWRFRERIVSLAIVPVGLTDHRFGLTPLRRVDAPYASALLERVLPWHEEFRRECGRGFVYPSDEFFILAGRALPPARFYDGFPQTENGVGIVRQFLGDLGKQAKKFPAALRSRRRLLLATAVLPSGFMRDGVLPKLRRVRNLDVDLVTVPNTLFGEAVTVAGLLSGKCLYSALKDSGPADLVLLPPDILNADGLFLDDMTPAGLEAQLGSRVMVFDGEWGEVFRTLQTATKAKRTGTLVRND